MGVLDDILRAMEVMSRLPPPPVFCACRLFPADRAIRFKDGDAEFLIAHPAFWDLATAAMPVNTGPPSLFAITIEDIDSDRVRRVQVFEAMARAMGGDEQ